MSKILSSEDLPNAFEHGDDDKKIDRLDIENTLQIDEKDNPILRAAHIHILGDIIQSLGVVIASMIAAFSVYGVSKLLFRNNKPQDLTRSKPKIYQPEIFSASTSTASSRSEKQEKMRPVP